MDVSSFSFYIIPVFAIIFAAFSLYISLYSSKKVSSRNVRQARSLKQTQLDSPSLRIAKWATLAVSVLSALLAAYALHFKFTTLSIRLGSMINLIIGSAYAQSAQNGANKVVADFIPYILLAVFGVMIVAFLVAVTVLVTTSSNEQNEKKLSAADNIVKTFGGFFIGFATSLLNIGSH